MSSVSLFLSEIGRLPAKSWTPRANIFALICVFCSFVPRMTRAQQPAVRPLLQLRAGHPRLMFLDSDIAAVRHLIANDPQAAQWHRNLIHDAEQILREPPAEHKLIGPRLLAQSRAALRRISLLAGLYRLDGQKAFAERARKELLAVCAFPDWHPAHFLDTAEMTNACAIGYDWLYSYLSPQDRQIIQQAIIQMGLEPGLQILQDHTGWTRYGNNWLQVCDGSLSIGALAIGDVDPDLANKVLAFCRQNLAPQMQQFVAPDGGCIEGPAYWNYSTIYTAYYLAALHTGLNTDFGFDAAPGLARTGLFRIEFVGPLGKTFNYADSHDRPGDAPQMFYFARLFNRPLYTQNECAFVGNHGSIFDLFWLASAPKPAHAIMPPLDALFRGVNVAFFRSNWNDPDAIYVGFKGGSNGASHAHLDLGSFVLDALGQRWALDLGSDNYNLPGYFSKTKRWTYYRLSTAGHNTLTINHKNQAIAAVAPIVAYKSSQDEAYAVANLTSAYGPADQIRRGIGLFHRGRILLMDEISLHKPCDITWRMHTPAHIELRNRRAILTLGGKTLYAQLLSPPGAKFDVESADPPPPNAKNPGVQVLRIDIHTQGPVRISVLFDIAKPDAPFFPQDLQQWVDESPVR